MEFRDALKMLRNELGLAQADIAIALHINIATVGRWEQGKTVPSRSFAMALLDYARSRHATSACMECLENTLNHAARKKLFDGKDSLFAVEHATISQIIAEAAFPLYVSDLDTDEILYANRAAERQLGKSLDALAGRKCYECIMHRDAPCESCRQSAPADDGFPGHGTTPSADAADDPGQGKPVCWNGRRARVRYLPDPDTAGGTPVSGIDARGAENDAEIDRLKALFEHINGGVSVAVFEDDGSMRLAYANDRYYELFGYTKDQFIKELKTPHETVHPDDWACAAEAIARVKQTKQGASFRYRIIKRDKSIAYLRCNASVTMMDGISGCVLISILTDITESVQTEQQAIVSGQRLDAIMKNMNSAVTASIIKSDGTLELLFTNDLHYRMLGYTREQYRVEVTDPFMPVHPDDMDAVRDAIFSLRRVGEETEVQYRVFTRDGRMRTLRMHIVMMTFPDAEGPVQLAVHADITDVAEAQEALSAQNNRIAELLNQTPSGIAIVEMDPKDMPGTMRTVYYNDRFISYSGYDRDEYDLLLKNNEMSFVFGEDVPVLMGDMKKLCAGPIGASADTTVRCRTKDGGYRWLLLTGQLAQRRGDVCVINVAIMDITQRKEAVERQRISEEMLRIAAETDQRSMIVYDVKSNSCRAESRTLFSAKYGEVFENIPRSLIDIGLCAPDSEDALCSLFARIREGEKTIRVSLQLRTGPGKYEWFECNASTVFDADGLADHAVLVFHNITEQRIKEAVFKKWQQSIDARLPEAYTLFRCNLSRDASLDQQDGALLKISFPAGTRTFNSRTRLYAEEFVFPDDREAYVRLLDSDLLLAMFYRGEHFASMDYRETGAAGEVKWLRLTVETVEYPDSTDVQAFLMYEDIDEAKRAEIEAMERAKSDPLTGAFNRSAFAEAVDETIRGNPNSPCALIMLDMDGFKQLNDSFGHAAGDQALQEVAAILRAYARSGDLVCRLGGDEFLVWLRDVPYDAVIGKTAQQMCEHIRKAYSQEVLLSASVGIAVYPRDGHSYDELYPNADKALYKVKQSGKGTHAFFSAVMEERTPEITQALSEVKPAPQSPRGTKRRMLIVDDHEIDRKLLKNIFQGEYLVETAKNGADAMIRMRHFGASLSVVLLDLRMPGIDGFSVLRKIQNDAELRTIPVIIVTGDARHETLLKAFELGAAEHVQKPVDADIVRMRVRAVISKAENERLRAQNSYLMLQRDEELKYRTVLESTETVVVEYDWRNHVFIYDDEIAKRIAGSYDHRGLWQIFLSDMVGESSDVKALQDALIRLGGSRERDRDSKLVMLNTPQRIKHWFRVNYYKIVDDFGLAEKLIITFNDVHEEVLATERLRFQATRDALTGLYNRSGFLEQAAELIKAREPGHYVMACIDVEKFQVINDRFGAETGDEVLKHIADAVGGFAQRHHGLCCRYAADKFAILYPAKLRDTDELTKNHRLVSTPGCIPHPLRLRIGRCTVNDTSLPVSALLDRATMAEALAKGRYDTHIVEYDESMRDNILREQQIAIDMVDALQKGEFEPWFQPQYNHATGALIGAEALVRWRRDGRIIPPGEFIPVFEKNGFIYEVDQYIWRSVCVLLRRWLDEGRDPLPVSVNISRHDMLQENIVSVLTALVAEYRLPVALLRLEITESAFSADTSVITDIAGRLIDAGFTVEIDDFGSGYSSLNTLKDVPASILKLDMRFFEQTGDARRGGNIVESVVRMAKWLGMAVIAEGVEDGAQADYLKSIGCFYIQGYLYAKPLPVEEYEKRLGADAKEAQLTRLQTLQNLDNNDFWDSHSMDTLVFNSYVGAACILEFCKDRVEMLRATDQYVQMLCGNTLDIQQVLAIDWSAHMDPMNIGMLADAVTESMETKAAVTCELEFRDLPGCPAISIIRSTLRVIAAAGEHILIYCLSENITSQRMAERAALNASERISAVMDHSHCGISAAIPRADGSVELIFVNNRFFELLGYTREQYAAEVKSPFDRIVPEDRDRVFNTVTNMHQIGSTVSAELREMRRDGSIIWIRCDVSMVRFANVPEPVQLTSYLDITQQKENELKQLESARRLEAVMENINGGISAVYLKNGRPEYVIANELYYEILGYTREAFEQNPPDPFDLLHPDDRERVRERVIEGQRVGERYSMEYRMIRRDGALRYILCNTSVVHLLGIAAPVELAVTNDITELRATQGRELAARDRLSVVMNAMSNGMTAVVLRETGMELLFANDRYYEMHGIRRDDINALRMSGALDIIVPKFRDTVRKAIRDAAGSGQPVTAEYQIRRPDGVVRWVRTTISMTRLADVADPVQVAVFTDITDEKQANDQIRFLNESAGEILAQPDSEKAINDALRKLLRFFAGERAYIFELDDAARTSDNTYEVCAPGVTAEIERLKGVPYDTQQYWFDAFRKTGFVAISDVSAIEDGEKAMRDILLVQNISSIIVAPLWRDGQLIGYMGVDNPTAAVDQVSRLIALADYVAILLTRRDLMKTLECEHQTVQQLMDDTPGGFVRMELFEDRNPTVVNVNSGLCKMLGMTKDEVMEAYGEDVFACLAEDDAVAAPDEIMKAYISGGQYTSTCKLRKKDGSLFWVMLFGRFVHGENGRVFLNAYFTDITEHRSVEQLQSALLDNLPFGAAMYEFDGRTLTAIHINKRYSEMVNRTVDTSPAEYAPVDAIHPDDRKRTFDEIRSAIMQKRNASCDIRLRYGRDEYRLFHLDANILPSGDGKYLLNVAYERITDQELALKETSERLKLLSDSIPGGIATFRCMPGNIEPVFYNDGICMLTGYSREEFGHSGASVLDLIFDEDKPVIKKQIELLMRGETALDYCARIHTKDGGYKWVECMANVTGREGDNVFLISAVLTDVTAQQEEREQLRVSEQLNRLAIDQSGNIITRYDVAARTLTLPYSLPEIFTLPKVLENMPEEQVRLGRISPDTAGAYCGVFERIGRGEASGEAVYQQNSTLGWRWLKSQFTTVFARDGKPVSAVITFEDITEQREKEAIYTRWQNTMAERAPDSYTLVRCNLNKSSIMDSWDGTLLRIRFADPAQPFNSRTAEYAERFVYADDQAAFRAFLNSDTMLAEYHRGHRSDFIDYREQNADGSVRWLRLSVDLVEYPDSRDVEAYLLFENINEQKHAELTTIRRAETDPLTGVLNRTTFAQRVDQIAGRFAPKACHALFMLDIDDFKNINDRLGHGAGDQALNDIANALTHFCRKDDLVGRLGGDEFFAFLSDIGGRETAEKKAKQLCDTARRKLGAGRQISVSIGVALCPQDGNSFEALYKAADGALYRTKNAGKDGYCVSSGDPVIHIHP